MECNSLRAIPRWFEEKGGRRNEFSSFVERIFASSLSRFQQGFQQGHLVNGNYDSKDGKDILNFIYRFIRYSNWNPITTSSSIPSYISSKSYGQLTILHIEINRKEKKDNIKNFVRNKSKISLTIQKWNWLILWLNTLHARINKRAWENKIDNSFVRPIEN